MDRFSNNGERKNAIREGNPVNECGLTLYPLTVRYMDDWRECKYALLLRLATLPAKYACKDWFSAIFSIDIDAMEANKAPAGFLYRFIKLLLLAMRLPVKHADELVRFNCKGDTKDISGISVYRPETVYEAVTADENGRLFTKRKPLERFGAKGVFAEIKAENEADFTGQFFIDEDTREIEGFGGEPGAKYFLKYTACSEKPISVLTNRELGRIRETLALQNGETLPDEAENPELIAAQNELASMGSAALEENIDELLASVAYKCGVRVKDLLDWPISEFFLRTRAIGRYARYVICGINEGSGASWKNGNPAPSWCYDRKELPVFSSVGQTLKKLGHSEEWLDAQMQK